MLRSYLSFLVAIGMVVALAGVGQAQVFDVWFGTRTGSKSLSQGIYHGRFNSKNGKLTDISLAAEISGPGFLAKHPDERTLYSLGVKNKTATVFSFAIQDDGKLVENGSVAAKDGPSAHIATDNSGRVLLTAQYGNGSVAAFQLDETGKVVSRSDLHEHEGGSGVVEKRQDAPHAHWVGTSPDNRFVFVPDLGMDKVLIYKLDAESGALTPHGFGQGIPGGGPRHMKFHTSGKYIYLLNEFALSVTVFEYDAEAGTMNAIQTIETLPESVKAKEVFNSCSEIRVHPSGDFVYAANRGNDSITAFRVNKENGRLSLIEVEPIHGAWPRNFSLDPTGNWLLAAGQNTNSITIFAVDPETGELTFTRDSVMVPSCICVLF